MSSSDTTEHHSPDTQNDLDLKKEIDELKSKLDEVLTILHARRGKPNGVDVDSRKK